MLEDPEVEYSDDKDGRVPDLSLHRACEEGNLATVQTLLSDGEIKIDHRGNMGRTPVMEAAKHGQKDVFEYLVIKQCNLMAINNNCNNILHMACIGGDVDIVRQVLDLNIYDKESRGQKRCTPLLVAAMYGHTDLFNFLMGRGCDLEAVDTDNANVLHWACIDGNVELVQTILSLKVIDKDAKGPYSWTPVMISARYGYLDLFNLLVAAECDLRVVDEDTHNILHIACIGGSVGIVKNLLSLDIVHNESRGQFKRTSLMIAATKGHTELFDFLVSNDCEVNAADEYGNNPLHIACINGHVNLVKNILSKFDKECKGRYNRTPLMLAAEKGHLELFNLLVNRDCDMKTIDVHNNSILHVACLGGNLTIVKHILSLDIVIKDGQGQFQRTPLMLAAEKGHLDLVKLLVSTGCDVTAVDGECNTVLHATCVSGSMDLVAHLLSLPVVQEMKTHKNRGGWTPVALAHLKNYHDIVSLFPMDTTLSLTQWVTSFFE